ncbi:MAG: hypothetical protein DPW18_11650 [Chloroflexi bacterium]|nr:hypothetical protein [Chloroflexota bacterium]MDL1942033.1 hypothetical protein [Chloroflexi bacterium CFX2]
MIKQRLATAGRILISALAGIVISLTLVQAYFDFASRAFMDRLFLALVPAAAVFVCLLYLFPAMEKAAAGISAPARRIVFLWAFITALLSFFVPYFSSFVSNPLSFIAHSPLLTLSSLFIVSLLLTMPAASSVQIMLEAGGQLRAFGAWLFASFFGFFIASFLDNFYASPIEIILLTLLLQAALGVGGYFFMGRVRRVAGERLFDAILHGALFLMLTGFIIWLFQANRRVALFLAEYFVLDEDTRGVFTFVSLIALPWQAWMHIQLKFGGFYNRIKHTKVYAYVSANLAGLSLALGFFVLYLLFASVVNDPHFDVDDIYFDADHFIYRIRLTTDNWRDYYWRSVHPFMILLLKPPVDLLGVLLKGNKLWGAYVFTALGGAACVYLAWTFIKSATGNSAYASLIAALLGFTASHLIFGSLLESYIFLAASLLLFHVLLIKDKPLPALIAASLTPIGITHSNFAQNVIALFTVKPNVRQTMRFIATVLVFLVLFTMLNNLLYPDAHPFFFVPSTLQAEQQNLFPLNNLRIQALAGGFFFHNIAAPTPIFYDQDIPFIQFRFFKPEIGELSQYTLPVQTVTAWVWLGLLLFAGALFVLNFRKNPYLRYSLALAGCFTLNIVLHLRYGKELFLYSPNWTYALVLFLGLAWGSVSNRRWFQAVLLVLLSLLIWNNGILLLTILDVLGSQV